jgi:hypothetical protein
MSRIGLLGERSGDRREVPRVVRIVADANLARGDTFSEHLSHRFSIPGAIAGHHDPYAWD